VASYSRVETYSISEGTGNNHGVKDIVPFTIGELAICFLHMPGCHPDNACISVTHVAQDSTKLPVLFTGDMLGVL